MSPSTRPSILMMSRWPPRLAGATIIIWALAAWDPARAYDPASARYSRDTSALFWIVHISDTHIGTDVYPETERFEWLLSEGLTVIAPELVVVSGDLVDGSANGIPASGQQDSEWILYRDFVDGAGMTTDYYIDLPGNHDGYGDPGLTHYLTFSLNGEVYGMTTRSELLSFSFGDYLVYGTATPEEDGTAFLESPEFSAAELAEMQAELTANASAELALVFGHHNLLQPSGGDQAEAILQQHQAMYFHGHRHE